MLTFAPPPPSSSPHPLQLKLVHILGELIDSPPFIATCSVLIGEGDAPGLIREFLSPPVGSAAPAASSSLNLSEDDVLSIFAMLTNIASRSPDAETESALVRELAHALETFNFVAPSSDSAAAASAAASAAAPARGMGGRNRPPPLETRLKALVLMYNLRSSPTDRNDILVSIVRLACAGNLLSSVTDALGQVEDLIVEWRLTIQQTRELYLTLSSSLSECASNFGSALASSCCDSYYRRWAATYDADASLSAASLTAGERKAVKAALEGALRDPLASFGVGAVGSAGFNNARGAPPLLSTRLASTLAEDKEFKGALSLLRIFAEGNLTDFESFAASPLGTSLLSSPSSSLPPHSTLVRHMRLLTLCGLASSAVEVPYAAVAAALSVPKEDVERWVLEGVAGGLLAARLDQVRGIVVVERCVVRSFGPEDWKDVGRRLKEWRDNVKGLMDNLKEREKSSGLQSGGGKGGR